MKIYPEIEEVKLYAKTYDLVPVMAEMMADMLTPVNLFMSIKNKYQDCFLLESAENGSQFGRYSFIGFEPDLSIQFANGIMKINGKEISTRDPLGEIEKIMTERKSPTIAEMPKFTGGLIGYFGYDTVRYIETKLTYCPKDDIQIPEIALMGCSSVIVFDHLKHNILLIVNVETAGDLEANYRQGMKKIEEMIFLVQNPSTVQKREHPREEIQITTTLTQQEHCENIAKAIQYIQNGDIFQVVLSQRFDIENAPDAFNVYRMLRAGNPSPYMYYFNFYGIEIAGSSPEMLVSAAEGKVYTHPIAGTIKRGGNKEEDNKLKEILINDKKELAEHTMLLDLGRNDIGKVSEFGTVNVERFMEIEEYATLMHIVSRVSGTLRKDLLPLDALKACLPAGTLSGAPKVRAMEIIDELEPTKRNLYGGAIGYLGYNQTLDTCIAIRTALFKDGKAYVQAGGGIVADSEDIKEYEEAKTKASAVITAIKKAGELA